MEAVHPEQQAASQSSPTQTTLGISTSSCVREHLCFVSIYFLNPLARCVLRYQKYWRKVIFSGLGMLRTFPYKLMTTASPLSTISA